MTVSLRNMLQEMAHRQTETADPTQDAVEEVGEVEHVELVEGPSEPQRVGDIGESRAAAHANETGDGLEQQPAVQLAKTTRHILKYPIAKSAIEAVQAVDYPRAVSPHLVQFRQTAPVKPLFDVVDNINDGILDQVDKMVPQLQTLKTQEVIEAASAPIRNAREEATRITHTAEENFNNTLITPLRQFHQRYSGFLVNSEGRAIIRGRADPVIRPLNDLLQRLVDEHLAEGDAVPADGFTNELSRSSRILINGLQRARPLLRSLPAQLGNQVSQSFEHNRAKETDTYFGALRATMATGNQLSRDAWTRFWSALRPSMPNMAEASR